MHVRPALPQDAEAIAEAHVRSWQAAYTGLLPAEMLSGLDAEIPNRIERWRQSIGSGRNTVLSAELDGAVVGFSLSGPCRDTDHGLLHKVGEVLAIYLKPEAWGRGLGNRLMAAAEDDLIARGCPSGCVWVLEHNVRARRFYELAGWATDGVEKTETRPGMTLHEVRYTKDL